jgi:hypothetical protein
VQIRGAYVTGRFDLTYQLLARDLLITDCVFDDAVDLSDSRTRALVRLDGCSMPTLTARRLVAHQDLELRRLRVAGPTSLAGVRVAGDLRCMDSAFGGVDLASAHVGGNLDLRGASVSNPEGPALMADGAHVVEDVLLDGGFEARGEVRLVAARVGGQLRCTRGSFLRRGGRALDAQSVEAASVYLDRGFRAEGEVRLVSAKLTTLLNCTAGSFSHPTGYALDADNLVCGGDVFLDRGFEAAGEVRVVGAKVSHGLNCTGAHLENPGGIALHGDGLTTEGSVYLNHDPQGGQFRATGQVRLSRATVGRQLDCVGGSFQNGDDVALDVSGVVDEGDVLLSKGFRAAGGVRLWGARVRRDLDCGGANLTATTGRNAFDAVGARVGGRLVWTMPDPPSGRVDLSFARATVLADDSKSWPAEGQLVLSGFEYESLDSEMPLEDRLRWLQGTREFSPLPYEQLARTLRKAQRESWARVVKIEQHRDQRKRGHLRWWSRGWDWFVDHTTGFGYRFYRLLPIVLVLGLIGWGIFSIAASFHLMEPTRDAKGVTATACNAGQNYPCFEPWLYSFQLLLPGLNLWLLSYWLPNPQKVGGILVLAFTTLYIAIGYVLAAAVIGALRHLLFED